jgi:phospholipid/cholesterol/gamma-HCH transport system permease protein
VGSAAPQARVDATARRIDFSGDWNAAPFPDREALLRGVAAKPGPWTADVGSVGSWDARLTALLLQIHRQVERDSPDQALQLLGAPEAQQRLFSLATAVPLQSQGTPEGKPLWSLARLNGFLHDIGQGLIDALAFLGDALRALGRTLLGRGAMRRRELLEACFRTGPDALAIITLTSVLVGMILAYLGAAQLQQFGASIYVANLVTIGMLREMGALMTAVVMAGRTGAAYAAQLSTMQGAEEIDAIRTLGIDPMEYLVVPRIVALVAMMPLLVIFADALGILGGALVAGGMGVTPLQYLTQFEGAFALNHFLVGMAKSLVFALLIALAGCRAGISAGRSSAAVGAATTNAVVTAVVYLIIADAAINIICQQLSL